MSKFVTFGNVSLSRSNIKSFGFSTGIHPDGKSHISQRLKIGSASNLLQFAAYKIASFLPSSPEPQRYFFVTTFQNDNYVFWECEHDIDAYYKLMKG